jgi:hypothetical protein
VWPNAWVDISKGAVLSKTNGFRALMRLMKPVYYTLGKELGNIATTDEVLILLEKSSLLENEITTTIFQPGTSGEALLFNRLVSELALKLKP